MEEKYRKTNGKKRGEKLSDNSSFSQKKTTEDWYAQETVYIYCDKD